MIGLLYAVLALAAFLVAQVRPGVNVSGRDSSDSTRTLPIDTGQTFTAVVSERGPSGVNKVKSWAQYQRDYGGRTNITARYFDAVEQFFAKGGSVLYVTRLDGPAAAVADVDLLDGAAVSLAATAVGTGTWYNGLNIDVEENPDDATQVRVRLSHDTDPSVTETSPYYGTQDELRQWTLNSRYVRLAIGAAPGLPDEATYNLAGGLDAPAGVVTATRTAALALFTDNLGTGLVAIPGATVAADWDTILAHAEDFNRSAVLDYPDTGDEATLITLARTARARGKAGAGFAGWLDVPFSGSLTKRVAPSLAICGKIARHDSDSDGLGQNKPVAGIRRGRLDRVLGVSQAWVDKDQRTLLNSEGVNLIRDLPGFGPTIWGWRSLASESNEPGWINFGHRRLQTALFARIDTVMTRFVFEEIDGEGTLFGQVRAAIKNEVVHPYFRVGSLFGATAEDAYLIDTDSVNDEDTIEDRQLNVSVTVVESEFAEQVNAVVTKNLITQGVNA